MVLGCKRGKSLCDGRITVAVLGSKVGVQNVICCNTRRFDCICEKRSGGMTVQLLLVE